MRPALRNPILFLVRSALLVFVVAAAGAQQPPSAASSAPVAGISKFPQTAPAARGFLKLDVSVLDEKGDPLRGVAASDVTLLDDGHPVKLVTWKENEPAPASAQPAGGTAPAKEGPLELHELTAQPDPPAEIILVVDVRNTPSSAVARMTAEIQPLLLRNDGKLPCRMTIYEFTAMGLTSSGEPSQDGKAMASLLAHWKPLHTFQNTLPQPYTFTTSYGSEKATASLQAVGTIAIDQRDRPARKLLFWLGQGWPPPLLGNAAASASAEFATRLREARIRVYQIAAADARKDGDGKAQHASRLVEPSPMADLTLAGLAAATGGSVETDAGAAFDRALRTANSYYTLSFNPPRATAIDEVHTLKLAVSLPGAAAHVAAGYIDEPSFYDIPPAHVERLTVAGLQQLLAAGGRSDGELARRLAASQLTERLVPARLQALQELVSGKRSSSALVALADAAALLPPPAADIPNLPPPSIDSQRKMLARAIDTTETVNARFPDLFAQRGTVTYEETLATTADQWKSAPADQTLHAEKEEKATVLYRGSGEVVETSGHKRRPYSPAVGGIASRDEHRLVTTGTFGPVMGTVLLGALGRGGELHWLRWEKGPSGNLAVFYIHVWQSPRLFDVSYCCLPTRDGKTVFDRRSSYDGEIALDPDTGSVYRLVMRADIDPAREPDLPINVFAIVIEYGAVNIGGTSYICPVHTISFSRGRALRMMFDWGMPVSVYGPFETILTDASFFDYHLFRSVARILPDYDPMPDSKTAPSPR